MILELTDAEWIALTLSLKVALTGVAVSLPFGFAIAWLLARKSFPGKLLLDGLVHLPLVVPPVATGTRRQKCLHLRPTSGQPKRHD